MTQMTLDLLKRYNIRKRYKDYEEMTEHEKRRIISEALYQMRCPGEGTPSVFTGFARAVEAVETDEYKQWCKDNHLTIQNYPEEHEQWLLDSLAALRSRSKSSTEELIL